MRVHYLRIILVLMIAFVLLISQGCMRINFIGEGRKDKERQEKSAQPKGPLDEEPRIDTQGDVAVEIRFAGITFREDLAFNVEIKNRSAKLGQYPFDKNSTLANDLGTQVQASMWEISFISASGDTLSGTIYFPAKDASGKPLISQEVRNLTLKIEDLAGIPERVFQWSISPGQGREGERTIEKILWVDEDGVMHLSFPSLWRGIKNTFRKIQSGGKVNEASKSFF
jgi:hypothetical protein